MGVWVCICDDGREDGCEVEEEARRSDDSEDAADGFEDEIDGSLQLTFLGGPQT